MNLERFSPEWLLVGFLGQGMFTCRFLAQWIVSERRRRSVVPVAFWWFSLAGGGLLLLYALRLRRSMRAWPELLLAPQAQSARPWLAAATAAVAFWWLTSVLVRTLHQWMGTPMWGAGTLDSGLVQTGLSILWTVLALATMFLGTRRVGAEHARTVWLAGGALLAVVVVKLMLVDLSQTSALQRIVSFVGVGLLMLVVGYVAPIPPQRSSPAAGHRP
jgi:uncharacterized membrane protein